LHTFVTDLETTEKVAPLIPPSSIIVSESGIATFADVKKVQTYGANAMLVGESLMRKADVEAAVYGLFGEVDSLARPS
jgi:indole-3-glycerol phosphate synthase